MAKKDELSLEKGRIHRHANQVTKKTKIIEDKVKSWIEKVNNILEEVQCLEREMEADKCYQG